MRKLLNVILVEVTVVGVFALELHSFVGVSEVGKVTILFPYPKVGRRQQAVSGSSAASAERRSSISVSDRIDKLLYFKALLTLVLVDRQVTAP